MRPELEDTLAAPSQPATTPEPAAADRTHTAHHSGVRDPKPGLASGHQLGHFRVERPLGAGGMGEVYLATDLALDRPVALKVLPEGTARDPSRRDRLIREARAQARIVHPNVAHIYYVGEEAGRLFFAMELVGGKTLAERVAEGPVPLDEAIAIVRAAALGLREAQRSGFTHRDVKPSNLMVDSHGMVKLLDFGLAAGGLGETAPDAPVAQTSLAGTPLYMAPEQARGAPVDFRTDIYALGATLFHLVSGKPPFEADTVEALVSKHASEPRPALTRHKGQARQTVASVTALCNRMMAADPAARFDSYDELLRALELASAEHTRPAGLWVRAMCGGIDIAIAGGVAGLAVLLASVLGVFADDLHAGPAIWTLFALYEIIATGRWGRTLGQWLFELEVVDVRTGARPTMRQAAIRVAVSSGYVFAQSWLSYGTDLAGYDIVGIPHVIIELGVLWIPLALIYATVRSPGKRTVWDKLSTTMVRYRTLRTSQIT